MTETCIESARQWINRLETELTELQARPDYRKQIQIAEGIRQEIERVQQVVALTLLRSEQQVSA